MNRKVWIGTHTTVVASQIGYQMHDVNNIKRRTLEGSLKDLKRFLYSKGRTLNGWVITDISDEGIVENRLTIEEAERIIKISKL